MEAQEIIIGAEKTQFLFDGKLGHLANRRDLKQIVVLTDQHLFQCYEEFLKDFRVITIPAGEISKQLSTVEKICQQLIDLQIDRNALLVGFGGGVVCDIAGFVAGIYKRGIRCALIPSSVLAMVDAAVGGKNGVNIGDNKNMTGLIRQPEFILYDYSLLKTLPDVEWRSGFAEIIKHACIADKELFEILLSQNIIDFKNDQDKLAALIRRNALLKVGFVQADPFENAERKKLNFGHTLAHEIERKLELKHGYAVAIGMIFAADVSEKKFSFRGKNRLIQLLENYQLPVTLDVPVEETFCYFKADKKRIENKIYFILLEEIGKPVIYPLNLLNLQNYLAQWK